MIDMPVCYAVLVHELETLIQWEKKVIMILRTFQKEKVTLPQEIARHIPQLQKQSRKGMQMYRDPKGMA